MRDCPDLHRVRVAPDETDTIYISGLPTTQPADSKQTLTEQSLIDFFGAIGKIHEAKSKADPRGPKLPKVKLYRTPQGGIKGDATVSYEGENQERMFNSFASHLNRIASTVAMDKNANLQMTISLFLNSDATSQHS